MRAVADLTAAASTSPAPESSSPVLATSACYPRALGFPVTAATPAPLLPQSPRLYGNNHARPTRSSDTKGSGRRPAPLSLASASRPRERLSMLLCMDSSSIASEPGRSGDFPDLYVWILARKGPFWPFWETFHTFMYGFLSQGPAQAPRPLLSIPPCMDSSATALACGERHLAVSAWVVSPVCPHPALYDRAGIG